jgi:hypothetical protein
MLFLFAAAGHCLLPNQEEGLLLALGGALEASDPPQFSFMQRNIFMYDLRGGSWTANPSGCTWPGAGNATGRVSAVPLDPFTVMVLSCEACDAEVAPADDAAAAAAAGADDWAVYGGESDASNDSDYYTDDEEAAAAAAAAARPAPGTTANVDLLDLRMWRWRKGAALHRRSGYLLSMSLVMHEGRAVALGGARPGFLHGGSREVNAFDAKADAWSTLPPLPFAVCEASAVAVNMRSAMQK